MSGKICQKIEFNRPLTIRHGKVCMTFKWRPDNKRLNFISLAYEN